MVYIKRVFELHACVGTLNLASDERRVLETQHTFTRIGSRTTKTNGDRRGDHYEHGSTAMKGVVADGKLFVISTVVDSSKDLLVYDPQSNSWTEEAPPPTVTNPDDAPDVWITVNSACAHKNRLVVFLSSGRAFERANDGSWSPLEFAAALSDDDLVESVILCLLYTSPSPRDQRGSRMPSSA